MPADAPHPLGPVLAGAAAGRPPAPDGSVTVLPAAPGPVDAVVAFTAHHLVVADVDAGAVRERLPAGDLGAPLGAPFLAWLGGRLGAEPGSVDVVLAGTGTGDPPPIGLRRREDLRDHPRVARAGDYRTGVLVYADQRADGLVVLGRGLAGRWELAFEVAPEARGRGLGRRLAAAALHLVPAGEPLFAQVAAGNAASLRVVVAAGFRPIGAEVLFLR